MKSSPFQAPSILKSKKDETMENIMIFGIIAFFLMLCLFAFIPYLMGISEDIRYYKMEIKRSTNENQRKFWQTKLRRFILKQIPIVNLFIKGNK